MFVVRLTTAPRRTKNSNAPTRMEIEFSNFLSSPITLVANDKTLPKVEKPEEFFTPESASEHYLNIAALRFDLPPPKQVIN